MKGLIYIDNLPMFEKYEFIDTNENTWKDFYEKNNLDMRGVDQLYIKGVNRVKREKNTIPCDTFFSEYLKLGKKLFELVYKHHKIIIKNPYQIDDSLDLKERYIEYNYLDIASGLQRDENNLITSIQELLYELEVIKFKQHVDKKLIMKIAREGNESLCDILLISWFKYYDIHDFLVRLNNILNDRIKMIDIELESIIMDKIFSDEPTNYDKIQNDFFDELKSLRSELEAIIPYESVERKLKVELSNSCIKPLTHINNYSFHNYTGAPLMTILFSYNQLKDIEKVVLPFLKKFGFPYFVEFEDEQEYHNAGASIITINDNEEIIPGNILIENSIFNYMYYTLYSDWEATDERILNIFNFTTKEEFKSSKELSGSTFFRTNRKNIINIKNSLDYYNNEVCSKILNFTSKYSTTKKKLDDNYFRTIGNNGIIWKEFNNLCIAMNILIQEQTSNFVVEEKYKKCPICGKKFSPSSKHKKYCSNKCSTQGRKINDRKRKSR